PAPNPANRNVHTTTPPLHTKFKTIPVYVETMPQVQTSRFDSTNFTAKQKVIQKPACTNRIIDGNRK
ncbi:hypothetical protein NAI52_10950, partial [Francisella tularensis subsp. holarctica]|uniref:hypothetical protein n=1 Tax=Francisella tularensis TaxID=263 RepID=UPI0023819758